jgi:hypothetical protein
LPKSSKATTWVPRTQELACCGWPLRHVTASTSSRNLLACLTAFGATKSYFQILILNPEGCFYCLWLWQEWGTYLTYIGRKTTPSNLWRWKYFAPSFLSSQHAESWFSEHILKQPCVRRMAIKLVKAVLCSHLCVTLCKSTETACKCNIFGL